MAKLHGKAGPKRKRSAPEPGERRQSWVRLFWIQQWLRSKRKATAARMAAEMEVSRKVIRADLDNLRDFHGAIITWDVARQTYVLEKDSDILPQVEFTEAEITAMMVSAMATAGFGGPALRLPMESVVKKLGHVANLASFSATDPLFEFVVIASERWGHPALAEISAFATIVAAGRARQKIRCLHRKPGEPRDGGPIRVLDPLNVAFVSGKWVLFAREQDSDLVKAFRLSRFSQVEALDETFERPTSWNVKERLALAAGRCIGGEEVTVVARVTKKIRDYLEEEAWTETHDIAPTPDERGWYQVTWRVSHLFDLEQQLLACGRQAVVLSPPSFRAQMRAELAQLMAEYDRDEES